MKYTRLFEDFVNESDRDEFIKIRDNRVKANDIQHNSFELKAKIKDNFEKEVPAYKNEILALQIEKNDLKLKLIDLDNRILKLKIDNE